MQWKHVYGVWVISKKKASLYKTRFVQLQFISQNSPFSKPFPFPALKICIIIAFVKLMFRLVRKTVALKTHLTLKCVISGRTKFMDFLESPIGNAPNADHSPPAAFIFCTLHQSYKILISYKEHTHHTKLYPFCNSALCVHCSVLFPPGVEGQTYLNKS